jgi:hypothetical protein
MPLAFLESPSRFIARAEGAMLSDLRNIPSVMRTIHWPNSGRLLDRWFSLPRTVVPSYSTPETTLRMSWILGFARARKVYDEMIRQKIWVNPAGQGAIAAMLRRKGLLTQATQSFGRLSDPVVAQDPDYVNQRPAGGYTDFDDLTGTLGAFNFRVVVAGTVRPIGATGLPGRRPFGSAHLQYARRGPSSGPSFHVQITEVGVYVRDSFDFEGDQYLGCWSDSPHGFTPLMPPAPALPTAGFAPAVFTPPLFTPVGNRDFRTWRDRYARGGDFLVFSDLQRVMLSKPDEFTIG